MEQHLIQPELQDFGSYPFQKPKKETLNNGLDIFLIEGGNTDVCKIEIVFSNTNPTKFNHVVRDYCIKLMQDGTIHNSSKQIAEILDFYGAYIQNESGYDSSKIVLYSASKFTPYLLPTFVEILTEAVYISTELEIAKSKEKQNFQIKMEQVSTLARRQFMQNLFHGSEHYGNPIELEEHDAITSKQLRECSEYLLKEGNPFIIISGKGLNEVFAELDIRFSDLPINKKAKQKEADLGTPNYGLFCIDKPNSVQSAIRIGCIAPKRGDRDYFGMKILTTLFGGYFGSRLMTNIREEKGFTYGIGAGIMNIGTTAFLSIGTEVGVENTAETISEIKKEMNLLKVELVSEQELQTVKSYLKGAYLGGFDGPFSQADRWADLHQEGFDESYFVNYLKALNDITPIQIQELANKYFNTEKLVISVAGTVI